MHLSRLYIKGFRSIRELDLIFSAGKNVIIGRNNAGKSNIVRALDIVLGEAAPAFQKSENITEADFHAYNTGTLFGQESVNELVIWAELERGAGEELDWHEIDKCFGYNYHGKRADQSAGGQPQPHRIESQNIVDVVQRAFSVSEESYDRVYVNPKLKNQPGFRPHLNPMNCFAYVLKANLTDKGIAKELRFLYRETPELGWILAFRASIRTELLQSAILPAFRDPATQLRLSNWTWFGKLMRHLTKDCTEDAGLRDALAKVQTEGDRIFLGVTGQVENDALSVSFPDAKLSIQFHGDNDAELYKNCGLYVDDGFKSPLTDKGAGIQSATIMGLFTFYMQKVNVTASALLCVEEPELYLHPHGRRVISDRLDAFVHNRRHQVILTTHGVEFLRTARENYNLILVTKSKETATAAKYINAESFLTLLLNNNQNELFFADKVILCEGMDEHILRAASEELYPGILDQKNVSVVAVEGKERISKLAKVILGLGIECFVLCDFDFLLRDGKPSLESLPDDFFAQPRFKSASKPVQKSHIAKLRNELRTADPTAFERGRRRSEFAVHTLDTALPKLRAAGIGILDGEIEDLSKDRSWVAPTSKKLDTSKIYELREKIAAGTPPSKLFELKPLFELLEAVFAT